MRTPGRQAFTIVELLVVIAIIAVLTGLLLPAVQAARESGRKAACMNNLYQLGMAANRFDQDVGRVPCWGNLVAGRTVSWPVVLLPNLERNDLYDAWAGDPTVGAVVNSFTCPTSRASSNSRPLAYAANCGDGTNNVSNGVIPPSGISYSLGDISDGDGVGTTLLFAEKCPNVNQADWGFNGFSGFSFQENGLDGNNSQLQLPAFGIWHVSGDTGASIPKSMHPDGFNVAFCDGHTKFINNSISGTTLLQLITSKNSGASTWFKTTVLDEGAY